MQYKYHITTYGCQMNKNDSERIEVVLNKMGLQSTGDVESADVVILNTCSVRDSAEARIFGQGANFAKLKQKKPNLIVAVTGCMPGRDKTKELKKRIPWVDLYFANEEMIHLPKWLAEL